MDDIREILEEKAKAAFEIKDWDTVIYCAEHLKKLDEEIIIYKLIRSPEKRIFDTEGKRIR